MHAMNHQRQPKTAYLSILFIIGFGIFSFADDVDDQQIPQTTDVDSDTFTLMEFEAMNVYRNSRRDALVESLALSNLSDEHQELISNAIAKIYVGIPVSSFKHTSRFESMQDETVVSTDTSHVSVDGHIQQENVSYKSSLNTNSPFMYFPPVPLVSETGKLLEESDSNATFEFDFNPSTEVEVEDVKRPDLTETLKFDWAIEFTVSKAEQAPERITIKLRKPVRKRFRFKMTTFQMDFHYSFIESCGCFAVNRTSTEMKGSAIIVGSLNESTERTNTDINCEQPVQFLLPDTRESRFLVF